MDIIAYRRGITLFNNSHFYDAHEVLEGKLPRIDRLSNAVLEWPRGFGQYTVGSRFLEWIRGEYGLGALRDLSHDYGSRAIPLRGI